MRVVEYQTLNNLTGRVPAIPVEYETAVKALGECLSIDEAKHWSDKADALAAWAKIYRSDEAGRKARQLRLHAYRRMGQIAGEIQPTGSRKEGRGRTPGPPSLLRAHGFNSTQALAARRLANQSDEQFESLLSRSKPPSPTANLYDLTGRNPQWASAYQRMQALRSTARLHDAAELAQSIGDEDAETARRMALDLIEWLDSFESHLKSATR